MFILGHVYLCEAKLFCVCPLIVWLSVPVQLIAWKYAPPK